MLKFVILCNILFLEFNTAENNFINNGHSNEISEDFWEYQEQVFNGLQENNTYNDPNIIEKNIRLVWNSLHS